MDGPIRFFSDEKRFNTAICVQPGARIGRGAKARNLNLLGGKGLQYATISGRREQASGHAKGAFQQIAIGTKTAQAIGFTPIEVCDAKPKARTTPLLSVSGFPVR